MNASQHKEVETKIVGLVEDVPTLDTMTLAFEDIVKAIAVADQCNLKWLKTRTRNVQPLLPWLMLKVLGVNNLKHFHQQHPSFQA